MPRVLILAVLLITAGTAAAETLPLTVDFGGEESAHPAFVKGGIPFAKGALKSPDSVRLLEDGKEAPLQVRALATWPDGSVKWLLVDFSADARKTYALEFGPGVVRAPVPYFIATNTDDGVVVDTGVVRFSVRKPGSGFIDELSFDANGDGRYTDDEKVVAPAAGGVQRNFLNYVHVEKPEDFPADSRFAKGVLDRSVVRVDEIAVEESGPIRACVRIRGKYLYDKVGTTAQHPPSKENQFTVRIHAWKGSGILRAEHSFVFEGDPDHDFVRTMGLALDSKSLVDPAGGIDALYQSSADGYEFYQAKAGKVDSTERWGGSAGTLTASANNWSVSVGIRNMRELYPKALRADRDAGRVVAYLYPSEARPLDMRRYARKEYGCGEGNGYDTEPGREYPELAGFSRSASRGVGRSHDAFFAFARKDKNAEADLSAIALAEAEAAEALRLAERGVVVRAPLDTMAKSRALGPYALFKGGPYDDVEKNALKTLDYSLDAQERFRWFGFFDFGDQQSRFNYQRTGRWESDWGRWGWGNNDGIGRFSLAFANAYLATGERKYFDALESAARHTAEVDVMHTDTVVQETDPVRVRGLSHRHGVQHWSEPYIGLRGSSCIGWRVYYYLSGEERLRDVLEEVVDCAMTDRYANSGPVNSFDGGGSAGVALLTMWEITGDAKYRDKLKWKMEQTPAPENSWHAGLSVAMGFHEAALQFHDLTGDAKAREHLIKAADFTLSYVPKPGQSWPFSQVRTLAEAWRITGEDKYRRHAEKLLDEYRLALDADPRVRMERAQWPGGGFAFELQNMEFKNILALPYALWAFEGGRP